MDSFTVDFFGRVISERRGEIRYGGGAPTGIDLI